MRARRKAGPAISSPSFQRRLESILICRTNRSGLDPTGFTISIQDGEQTAWKDASKGQHRQSATIQTEIASAPFSRTAN
jgi:hypothetical protein